MVFNLLFIYNNMIFAADIDQFCTVKGIIRDEYTFNVVSFFNTRHNHNVYDSIKYIPREFFNMIQIIMINFDFVDPGKYYNNKTRVINHNNCKWINLANLTIKYNLICEL